MVWTDWRNPVARGRRRQNGGTANTYIIGGKEEQTKIWKRVAGVHRGAQTLIKILSSSWQNIPLPLHQPSGNKERRKTQKKTREKDTRKGHEKRTREKLHHKIWFISLTPSDKMHLRTFYARLQKIKTLSKFFSPSLTRIFSLLNFLHLLRELLKVSPPLPAWGIWMHYHEGKIRFVAIFLVPHAPCLRCFDSQVYFLLLVSLEFAVKKYFCL